MGKQFQQFASAAAIWERLAGAFDPFDHDALRRARAAKLARIGLSKPKIKAMKAIGRAIAKGAIDLDALAGMEADAALAAFEAGKIELFAGVPASRPLPSVDLTGRCAIVIGNEARGVSDALRAAALDVSIPTVGVESLNAAVAAGILLYEARRQRNIKP